MASSVEMLSGKRKKDYAAESAAQALEAQAAAMGFTPAAVASAELASSDGIAADEGEIEAGASAEPEELVAA